LDWIPAPRFRGDKFTPAQAGAGMTVYSVCRSRENGNPEKTGKYWIPASAGMTTNLY